MRQETMSSDERVDAAYAYPLEKPDRVPIVPLILDCALATLAGYTQAQMATDLDFGRKALIKVFEDFGGWDAVYTAQCMAWDQLTGFFPVKLRIPGIDVPDNYVLQVAEEEVLKVEDYDKIIEIGWDKFYFDEYLDRICTLPPDVRSAFPKMLEKYLTGCEEFKAQKGIQNAHGGGAFTPFFLFSLTRSLTKFTEDLYYRKEIVERVCQRFTDDTIAKWVPLVKQSGLKRFFYVDERASAFFYPPAVTERFFWPYAQQLVDAMWSEGIVTIFHLDANWDKNIPDFRKKLPKGSYNLHLDSTTDIFAAKEVLRGHGGIQGDVPPALFVLGDPEDIKSYVKRLIDECADDGGFVLNAGCSVPPDAKPENFRAFIDTAKTYELSK